MLTIRSYTSMLAHGFLRLGKSLSSKPFLLAVLVLDLMLTILPFVDQLNFTQWLWQSSQLSNSHELFTTAGAGVGWPGGPFYVAFWLPAYEVYVASGFNFYLAVLTFKLILLSFLLLTAYLVFLICKAEGLSRIGVLPLFILLNPAVVYVTLIWIQIDIIPVALVTLTYFLLRYTRIVDSTVGLCIAVLPLPSQPGFSFTIHSS